MKPRRHDCSNKLKGSLLKPITLAAILAAFAFYGCENDLHEVQALSWDTTSPSETAREVELVYSDSGKVQMVLSTPYLRRFTGDSQYVELPEGVKVIFYDTLMQEESRLTADYAVNRQSEKIMEARRNVVVVNNRGEKLNTEHLIWDAEKELIYTHEFVRITTDDEVITGTGMEADQTFSRYRIKKVIATLNIETDDQSAENP